MHAREYFVFGFTFLMGVFAGGYVYVMYFAPEYASEGPVAITEIDFRIQGQMTGGCQMGGGCASFVLHENYAYRYVPDDRSSEFESGVLDSFTFKDIEESLADASFKDLQLVGGACASAYDGTDYVYRVTYEGWEHTFNTCGTTFTNSPLEKQLRIVWDKMRDPDAQSAEENTGLNTNFLKDFLYSRFNARGE